MGNMCYVEEEVQNEKKPYEDDDLAKVKADALDVDDREKLKISYFKKIKMLGQGSYGKVFLVELQRGAKEYYAMKVIERKRIQKPSQLRHVLDERKILERARSDFVVKLCYAFQNHLKLYLIVEYMAGGELYHLMKNNLNLSEDCIRFYAAEILFGLEDLHNQKVIYRDLKPENILLSETGHIKLNDFGLSKVLRDDYERAETCCGTPDYVAPEILQGRSYTYTCDFYSLGCLIYEMFFGESPFHNSNKSQMYQDRLSKPIPLRSFLSDQAKDLLKRLLKINPEERLGYRGAAEVLKHQFFSTMDLTEMRKLKIKSPFPKIARFKNFDKKALLQQLSPLIETQQINKLENFTYFQSQ